MPRVSVIIPSYNHARYLSKAVDSVLAQTYQDYEILISDDCSTDETERVLRRYEKHSGITIFRQKARLGPVEQIHFLVSKAQGEYIALLNSDDMWKPSKLEKQVAFLDTHKDVDLCFTQAYLIHPSGMRISSVQTPLANIFLERNRSSAEWMYTFWTDGNHLCHPSLLARKAYYGTAFRLNSAFRQLPDFDLWTRMLMSHKCWIIQEPLTMHRRLPEGKNTSAASRENTTRLLNEQAIILANMVIEMPDELFQESFRKDFKNKDASTKDEIDCERFFLMKNYPYSGSVMDSYAMAFFVKKAMMPGFLQTMRTKYNMIEEDFFSMTKQSVTDKEIVFPADSKNFDQRAKCSAEPPPKDSRETCLEIPVMHCFDNNYVIPAAVSFYSMLIHANPTYTYKLFVLHSDITYQNQEKLTNLVTSFPNASLEFINMQGRFEDVWNSMVNTEHLSKEVLYKLVAPEIFPQYDRLIVTDVDVLFLDDIAPSWFALDQNPRALFAGVRQISPKNTFLETYYKGYETTVGEGFAKQIKVCGGYLVENLKALREEKMQPVFIDYLKTYGAKLLQAEQDVINFCTRESQIIYLPLNYVVCSYQYDMCEENDLIAATDPFYSYREIKESMEHPVQLHYATKVKPWNSPNSTKAEIWFDYLKESGFEEEYIKAVSVEAPYLPTPKYPGKFLRDENKKENHIVKVSVLVCCYNQKKYLEETLKAILEQETDFDYEIIVADDCSTDGSQKLIRSLQSINPNKMRKCILRKKNVGIAENYYDALKHVEGEYLAICDGDDLWLDNHKLQKQVDLLDKYPQCTVVCSNFKIHDVDRPEVGEQIFDVQSYMKTQNVNKKIYNFEDVLTHRFIASCTVMMRWLFHNNIPDFIRKYRVIDFPLELLHASAGDVMVISETLSCYNVHSESLSHSEPDLVPKQTLQQLYEINQFVNYHLTKAVNKYRSICLGKTVTSPFANPQGIPPATVLPSMQPQVTSPISVAAVMEDTRTPMRRTMENFYAYHVPESMKNLYRKIKRTKKA